MGRTGVVFALAGAALLLSGCRRYVSPAVGPLREVTVVTSQRAVVEPAMRLILQLPVPTPQPESEFELRFFEPGQFRTWSLFRTVLLVGTSRDTVVRGVLGARADSLPDGFGLFRVPNPWAANQELLVFASEGDTLLAAGLGRYAERIRETCRKIVLDHSARAVYHRGLNKAATDSLRERFAFGVDVPASWFLNQENAVVGFVYLFGHHPDRNVFVYWQEDERRLDPGLMFDLRDRLTAEYYDGDSSADSLREARFVDFLGDSCLRISGIWQNRRDAIGGPFVSYCLNYQGRFFLIDALVFNPGRRKLDGLFQAEAVLRTFTPR
ncbi:MAG: DUF4837 family protein [bacterium]